MSTTTTATLVEFLTARLDEDRSAALQRISAGENPYAKGEGTPNRTIADVDAKRRIVELHQDEHECREMRTGTYPSDWPDVAAWGRAGEPWRHAVTEAVEMPCPTLRLLALPYADHRDYREAWRP